MFGITNLKPSISVTSSHVECPVKGCTTTVSRQRVSFKREWEFFCPQHKIYISPSSFEYQKETDNLLWTDSSDMALLNEIKKVKRESRIWRETSEDAITWNVFRYLERSDLLLTFMNSIDSVHHSSAELILWSYSSALKCQYPLLNRARLKFGESVQRGSEPDIIILTDKTLFFIEAKVTAGNRTSGGKVDLQRHLNEPKFYKTGGGSWFSNVFSSKYEDVVTDQKYELMRFWLLGTWMAREENLNFQLINLVLKNKELIIESDFGKHINQTPGQTFSRIAWEDIFSIIFLLGLIDPDSKKLKDFHTDKSLGYRNGKLIPAFL